MPSVNQSASVSFPTSTLNVVQNLDIVDFLDTPILEASSTNIPASSSAPLAIVASLADDVKAVQFQDTTGASLGIYTDAAGANLKIIVNPGSDSLLYVKIPAGTALYIRNMANAAITVGNFAVNFFG